MPPVEQRRAPAPPAAAAVPEAKAPEAPPAEAPQVVLTTGEVLTSKELTDELVPVGLDTASIEAEVERRAALIAERRLEALLPEVTKAALAGLLAVNPNLRVPDELRKAGQAKVSERLPGDIRVRTVKPLKGITMGARTYTAPENVEVYMLPSHARELSSGINERNPYVVITG